MDDEVVARQITILRALIDRLRSESVSPADDPALLAAKILLNEKLASLQVSTIDER